MKKFLRNILLISLIVLGVIIIIEFALFLRPNLYSYKSQYVEAHLDDIHTLLLGNSHIERALAPAYMDEGTFNLAISGRPENYDVELAKMYIPRMKALENVVMPFDYTLFYLDRQVALADAGKRGVGALEESYKCMYYKYMGIRVDGFWYWSEVLHSKLDYLNRFFKSDEAARECDSLGYIKNELATRDHAWKNLQLPMDIDLSKPINQEIYDLLFDYYSTLAALANQQHARLIMLSTPMYETCRARMLPEVRQEMRTFVARLQEKYPNVTYLDYTDDPRFVDQDYFDAGHLSEYGAAKLSRILSDDIRSQRGQTPLCSGVSNENYSML